MSSDIVQIAPIIGLAFGFLLFLAIVQAFQKDPPFQPTMARKPWVEPQPQNPQPLKPPDVDPLRFVKKWVKEQEEKQKLEQLKADGMSVQALNRLRDSCLSLFDKKPLKTIPPVFIKPDDHFSPNAGAHYEPSKNVICFKESSVNRGTPGYLADTMKHELLHAWIDQHDFKGYRAHDDLFKAAADLLGIEWREDYRES